MHAGVQYVRNLGLMIPILPTIVFSDVDSVLSNPAPASLRRAAHALMHLASLRVHLVLCSMKTRAELVWLNQELGIRYPFVAEGGSAVFIPRGHLMIDVPGAKELPGHQAIELGQPYKDVVETLREVATGLGLTVMGFNDMSVDDVAHAWGLSLGRARLAKLRDYVEPFRLIDATPRTLDRLIMALERKRLHTVMRGQYQYVGSIRDRGRSIRLVTALFHETLGNVVTLGIADESALDTWMGFMDHRVLIQQDAGAPESLESGDWAEMILDIVRDIRRDYPIASIRRL